MGAPASHLHLYARDPRPGRDLFALCTVEGCGFSAPARDVVGYSMILDRQLDAGLMDQRNALRAERAARAADAASAREAKARADAAEVDHALSVKAEELKAALPGVTFGYLGNCGYGRGGWHDDRSWYIFLPHPGRTGTIHDRVGGFRTDDLALMLANWDQLAAVAARKMEGR